MSVPLVVLGVLALMTVAAFTAAAPMTYKARRRRLNRRRRWVAGHPGSAKAHDVVDLLRRSGLLMREARDLTDAAAERGVRSVTLYRWLNRLDDDIRVTVMRAGLSNRHLLDHVGQGTLPDLPGVREFAEAHGLAVAPVEEGGANAPRPTSPETPQDRAERMATDPVTVDDFEDLEQVAIVTMQETPVVPQPAAVERPAAVVATKPAAASARLLGSGLGTQTPVP
jgi:hypothetical protein